MTYSLLHTLKYDGSVLDEDGLVNLQKWFLQSERYLKQMAERHGLQQSAQPFGTSNIDISKVDDEVRATINLIGEKSIVLIENVLNTNTGTDDLGLRESLSKELINRSTRGRSSISLVQRKVEDAYNINIIYTSKDGGIESTVRLLLDKNIVFEATFSSLTNDILINDIIKGIKQFLTDN